MARWAIQDAQLLVSQENVWRKAKAQEIAAEAANPNSDIHVDTGLRFGRIALVPSVQLSGELPDQAHVRIGVRRGSTFVTVPDGDAQGVIRDGRWHPLDAPTTKACFALIDRHNLSNESKVPLGAYLGVRADATGVGLVLDEVQITDSVTPAPASRDFVGLGLKIELFPYQQSGAEFLVAMADRDTGVLLADQMGLGKTAQAIALLLDQKKHGPSLIVCPASLLRNWSREIESVAPSLTVITHAGPFRSGVAGGIDGFDIVITSYETLMSDLSFLGDVPWNVLALDEAQMIRNPETGRSRSVKSLKRRVSLALTGTPVENRLLDLWSISEFVVPALLGARSAFETVFPDEPERAEQLGRIIAPFTLRRLVADVATDLPELVHIETAFELLPDSASRYALEAAASNGPLAAITALRVLCAHADGFGWTPHEKLAPKVDHLLRLVKEAFSRREKVLIFASFQDSLDGMLEAVRSARPNAFLAIVDGRVPVSDRQTTIDLFTSFEGPGALFMNPQAAGVGLNITAANHVVHFNPEWNPALTSQATSRAHRRRQTLPVTAHHLFYENTIEEDALLKADWKRALARRVDDGTVEMKEEKTP